MKNTYSNLDVLRSFAVLSVVAAHLWHGCVDFQLCAYSEGTNQFLHNLSFTGVMFFFVHTCLVLMLSMDRAPAQHRARSFLIRRAFRIYPLCWATILLVLSTGLNGQPGTSLNALGGRGLAVNLLLVQNLVRSVPSVISPLWSLPWEVQMYLVLPLFYIVLRRYERWLPALPLWLFATFLASVATLSRAPRALHAAIFPPLFISGMVAYQLLRRQKNKPFIRKLPAGLWPLFVLGLFAAEGLLMGSHSFESQFGAVINASICLALGLAIPAFHDLRPGWMSLTTQQIAKYSYGTYLLHVPAFVIVFRALPFLPLAVKITAFLGLTALLSVLSFHLLEDPLIRLGKRLTKSTCSAPELDATRGFAPEKSASDRAVHTEVHMPSESLIPSSTQTPLVSIITPVYNALRWLPETMASVRAQTYTHWEHIFVDDGSTDGSLEFLEVMARDDRRLRVLCTARNGGPSEARNLAIDAARGRFLAFLDADDLWMPEKLARSVEWMTTHGYAFIYHDYRHLSHDGTRIGALIRGPEELDLRTLHVRRGTGGCLSVVLDRQRIPEFHFPTNFRFLHEDFCAWLSLIKQGHFGHRLPADLGRYRLSLHSRSSNKLIGAANAWVIYRTISKLSWLRAASWWILYAWNCFWLYRAARPLKAR